MRYYKLLFLLMFLNSSCSTIKETRFAPKHTGINEKLVPYFDKFFELSKRYDLTFKYSYTAEIVDINKGNVIGTCYYAPHYREIDIDRAFFEKASENAKFFLVAHEAVHCLCNRDHDHSGGEKYKKECKMETVQAKPGYFDDECPISIMSPRLPHDGCLNLYYDWYVHEMFDRCRPW